MADDRIRALERAWRDDPWSEPEAEALLLEVMRSRGIPGVSMRWLVGVLALMDVVSDEEFERRAERTGKDPVLKGLGAHPSLILSKLYGYEVPDPPGAALQVPQGMGDWIDFAGPPAPPGLTSEAF